MKKNNVLKIEFPIETLITITLFILSLFFLFAIRRIVVILFIAFIIMSALYPSVSWLEKRKVPKALAIGVIYIFGTISLVGLASLIAFPLVTQLADLLSRLPEFAGSLVDRVGPLKDWYIENEIDKQLADITKELAKGAVGFGGNFFNIFKQAWGIVGTVLGFISIVMLSLYMLVEHDRAMSAILGIIPLRDRVRANKIINKVEDQLGKWLRGQLVLSVIVGAMVWCVLALLRLEFSLPLAILAGVLEMIPNFGPLISLVPAWLLAVGTGTPFQIVAVPIAYWMIQQIENNYLVPQVMKKAVGLNPIITMVAFLIGAEIGSIPGAVLAVPIAAVIQILVKER